MLESHREKIEQIIKDIDQSLIDLKDARAKGYTLYDFAKGIDLLHQLVFWEKTRDYEDRLSKYFSVINDLNHVISEKTITHYNSCFGMLSDEVLSGNSTMQIKYFFPALL